MKYANFHILNMIMARGPPIYKEMAFGASDRKRLLINYPDKTHLFPITVHCTPFGLMIHT